jgi:hypothetical protein
MSVWRHLRIWTDGQELIARLVPIKENVEMRVMQALPIYDREASWPAAALSADN